MIRLPALLLLLLPLCGLAAEPEALDGAEFSETLARVGDIYIAGQPTEAGVREARSLGVGTIVSLRTPAEMTDSAEPGQVEASGMRFVSIPSGGEDHPFSPAEVRRFNEVVSEASGPVLLHCKSGTRATHLYVAWLVRYRNVPLEDALRIGRQIEFGRMPLEGYLDGKIDYRFVE